MYDCITIGAATRDVFLKSPEFKAKRDPSSATRRDLIIPLGAKVNVDEIFFETGGGATNAAVTFARQGLSVSCICRVGDDPGGKAIEESLEREGVDVSLFVKDEDQYTAYSIVPVVNGERSILVYRGASAGFKAGTIPKNKLETRWIFISSLGGDTTLLKHLVDWAEKHGIKTAVIPGSSELKKGPKVLVPIFAKADVVVMNREEAAAVTGVDFSKKEKVIHKLCLLTKGIGVITDAKYGVTACDKDYFYHVGTHENKAIERTGAGDAFASGFVAGLLKYENIEGALELAADNASSVVNFFGAKEGIIKKGRSPFKEKLKVTKEAIK